MTADNSAGPGDLSNTRSLVGSTVRDVRASWKSLALTDIAYKIITFIVLTPLVGVLFRALIAASGSAVLSDQDLLFFFLGPVGWFCFVAVGALWLGIAALEQASLMGIIYAKTANKRLGLSDALRFAAANAWPVVQVTTRIVAWTLLTIVPFLTVAVAVYLALLTDYDINYYLKEKPPIFQAALGIGGIIVAVLCAVLLRLFTGWFFALPLVLFEDVSPSSALRVSAERANGHRRVLLLWILGWALAISALSVLATGVVSLFGRLFIPTSTGSLHRLAAAIGVVMVVWAVVVLALNLLSATTLAAVFFNLYRRLGSDGSTDTSRLDVARVDLDEVRFRVTPLRLLVAGVVGAAAALAVGVLMARSVRLEDDVEIMAHRGASHAAPENTMAAFRKAIDDGADWIELDVQETADGEVVVFHDSDFMKLAGTDLKIWEATMDDLKKIDVGSWFAPAFKDERVPTLADVLGECRGKIRVNIELKYYGHDEQLEQRVVDLVESHDMVSDVALMSLDVEGVEKVKAIRPDWKVGLLMSVSAGDLKKIEADFLAINADFVDRRQIRAAHDNGKEVYVWTVNDAPTMSTMIGRGVDALLTDKPALARTVLQQRAQMSTPERLVLELATMLGVVPERGEP